MGGKGANLGELTRARLPVPRAFCVTTEAYREFVLRNELRDAILAELARIDYDDANDIQVRAATIRGWIADAPIPAEIADEIQAAHVQACLDDTLVSVRSSATAEDLPGASFAGQQDTYLNVRGVASVLEHVRLCWASLWTDRAVAYRRRQGFDHAEVLLAVVVQEMFPSAVAGVMFTANPVTANPDETVVNASWGLGEAVVAGKVNPDQYVFSRARGCVVDRLVADKRLMTVRRPDGQGSVDLDVPEEQRQVATLSDEEIAALCAIGQRIEAHYGFPQDVEWGYAAGRFAILQAREVTAADIDFWEGLELWQTPEARADLASERWTWSRAYSDEVQTGPSTPLFYSQLQFGMTRLKINALRLMGVKELLGYPAARFGEMPLFRWYGARAYYNLAYERERIRRFIPPFARDEAALWPFPVEEREAIRMMRFNWPHFLWTMGRLHATNPKVSLLRTTRHMYAGLEQWTKRAEEVWTTLDPETATLAEIADVEVRANAGSDFGTNVTLPFTVYLYVLPAALRELCRRWCGDTDGRIYNRLVAGLHTKTSEENIALWRLSRRVRQSPLLAELVRNRDGAAVLDVLGESADGRALRTELDLFLAAYGHRGGAERDAFHHRWRHRPDLVFSSLRPLLALDDEDDPARREEELHQRMLRTKSACLRKIGRSGLLGRPKAMFFARFLELVQDYFYYRDYERFYNDKNMSRPRDVFTRFARRFVANGLLSEVEDIFFLTRPEIALLEQGKLGARDVHLRVRSRRRVYEKYSGLEPPKYIRGWTKFDDGQLSDDPRALQGIAASSGVARGRARVCRRLEEISKVEKGDILVTVATDPGWTTVFSMIAGVVVETGGVVAHAVMISREYGLPCVAMLSRACDLIPDGARITVDGTTGRVLVEQE
ncbi:MAG: hypothetical protein IT304_05690 [Dehalococcoidia bacterium]|nr:hypothetical protein [Dehalococcoidia bacterium]